MARLRRGGRTFPVVNAVLLTGIGLLCVYPFVYILSLAVSDGRAVSSGQVLLWPIDPSLETFRYILSDGRLGIIRALANSILYTVAGTLFSVTITYLTAYALSKKRLLGTSAIMMAFVITWIFDAGIVPAYIVNQKLGFVNNWLVMVIPWGFNTFLLIITVTFLRSIPDELEESAVVDGANDLRVMRHVYLPLSRPVLATIGIFYAVQIWNSFLIPLIYFQDRSLAPIQLVLYQLLINSDDSNAAFNQVTFNGELIVPQGLQAVTMIFAILPILIFYPYAQRHFSQGILVGSVKG